MLCKRGIRHGIIVCCGQIDDKRIVPLGGMLAAEMDAPCSRRTSLPLPSKDRRGTGVQQVIVALLALTGAGDTAHGSRSSLSVC